jgi:DeoR/GlpR family transcriptional regulator of sugar metabolism
MARPLAVHRHEEIVRRVRAAGAVSVSELAHTFAVSHETIRRDLKLLAQRGHLSVVHGGATGHGGLQPVGGERASENPEGLAAIARAATRLVPDGASVLLDGGATTAALARELAARRGLTVCTNSLAHAALLCRVPGNRVYMLGGEVDCSEEATVGIDVAAAIANLRVDIAFVGAGGFARNGEPTDQSRSAAEMRGGMILSGQTYLVAEGDSFQRHLPFRVPNLERAAGLIVDRTPEAPLADAWKRLGLSLIVAP